MLAAAGPPLLAGTWLVLTGDGTCVRVGRGVIFADDVPELAGCCAADVDPVYGCPNSPGANERVEQKPSEELMTKVNPSLDL